MKEVSELRRALAEVNSTREATEEERKRQVEQEVDKIHQRYQGEKQLLTLTETISTYTHESSSSRSG